MGILFYFCFPMFRAVGLFLLCVFVHCSSVGQNQTIEKLKRALDQAATDREKSDILHQLATEEWDYDFESGRAYAAQAYQVAKESNYELGMVQALTDLGMHAYFVGDYQQARIYYNSAVRLCGTKNFGDFPSYTYTRLGNLLRVQAKFDSARICYQEALKLAGDENAHPFAASSAYYNLGLLDLELANYREALTGIGKSLLLREQIGDSLLMAECWKSLGMVHKNLSEFESAKRNYQLALEVALRYHDPELEMYCNINIGELAFLEGDYEKSIDLLSNALEILKKHNFKRYYALALQMIGRVFAAQGDYEKALVYYFDALKLSEELGNRQEAARVNAMVGWVYTYQRNFKLAEDYAIRSLSVMESIPDRDGIALAENLLGQINFRRRAFDAALVHYHRALALRKEIESPIPVANTTFNIARVYEEQGNLNKALDYLLEAVKVHQRFNNELAIDYNGIGALLIKMRQYGKAREYLDLAGRLAKENAILPEMRDNYKYQAMLARQENRYQDALNYYDRFNALDDSLTTRESVTRVAQLNALYQLEEKEKEIENLSQQNLVKQNQIEAQNAKIRFQNTVLGLSVAVVVLLTIVAYVLYQYYRSKARANLELSRLNREVHEKNEEIQSQSEELIEAYDVISATNKDLEATVNQRTSQLRQAYKELDTFFYRSSHDFRRPLTTFQGLAEVAKVTLKDPYAIELFNKVNETARGVDRMLVKLQSVSLIASSELPQEDIQFDNELDFVFEQFRSIILEKKIMIKREITVSKPFKSYPAIIRIILENLLENAIYFIAPESPTVSVSIHDEKQSLVMVVRDNGEGIAKEFHNRIFDMYFRANEKSKGNGLGLYIVRKAVEKLRGTVSFESEYGKGSTFTVTLPYPD